MTNTYSLFAKTMAMAVHLFTASGLVVGFWALIALEKEHWKTATLLMLLALLIDGIDGTFARMFRVKEVLPNFDGKTIDYVIDFFTYAILPAYFLYKTHLLPPQLEAIGVAMVLLVSAIYYGKEGMVSEGYHFIGFPVMWNVVVWYMFFIFSLSPLFNFLMIAFFSILHFVPIKYPYPSRTRQYQLLNVIMTVLLFVALAYSIYLAPEKTYWNYLAIVPVIYYAIVSLLYTFQTPKT